MTMERMNISANTQKLLDKATDDHKEGRVFDKTGRVKKNPELDKLTRQIAKQMAQDIKRHTGANGRGGAQAYHLHNYAVLVKWCIGFCCCHYGLYDTRGRASYYLGYHCDPECMEA
jgi:Rieske Fe-S protein